MRFLIDADLPRQSVKLIEARGHQAADVRDIGMGRVPDPEIARHAQASESCLFTGDFGFADVRSYPPEEYFGLVVLTFPNDVTADFILRLIDSVFDQPHLMARLPGRLAIVEPGRIRLRPP
jgi:predicted nuclease of predicted toxin-antitoxin system